MKRGNFNWKYSGCKMKLQWITVLGTFHTDKKLRYISAVETVVKQVKLKAIFEKLVV